MVQSLQKMPRYTMLLFLGCKSVFNTKSIAKNHFTRAVKHSRCITDRSLYSAELKDPGVYECKICSQTCVDLISYNEHATDHIDLSGFDLFLFCSETESEI